MLIFSMSTPPNRPSPYQEDTQVFVLASPSSKKFLCLTELATGRQWAYAFTDPEKAKAFVRLTRKDPSQNQIALLPCTLAEWFDWQPKKNYPDLMIDPDPQQLLDYPLHIPVNPEKDDISCLTVDLPHGKVYQVKVSPRKD
jgi:hypothetical protein